LPDWRLISAEGAVLDQIGQHDAAREKYQYALSLAPNEPAILSNIGMSHVLTGDLSTAEQALAKAGEHPRADSQVRQNLALVYGLQGRFDKAERIAKIDLSPDQVEQNMAYLRTLSAKRQAVSSEIDQRETTASVDRNSG
ncbi:MAG: tetratricopeptide repeat protein, partial [Pseudomonadota bacterium]